MQRRWMPWLRSYWVPLVGIATTIVLWFLIPLPFIVYEPGPVASTRTMVVVENAEEEEGVFLMTTVRWTYANLFTYVRAKLDPHAELHEKEKVTRGASRTDYVKQQRLYMRGSHSHAIEAVYRELNIPYEVRHSETVVFSVLEDLSAAGVLRPGDELIAVDGVALSSGGNLQEALGGKGIGATVGLTYRRGQTENQARLTLKQLPNTDPPRPGMGITYGTLETITSKDEAYAVQIQAGQIGGPSAGLMFALEIYNQFTELDWTKGYTIAGTGEMFPDGKVGSIGGVIHKVTASHRKGAELFFVPPGNADAAKAKAIELGTRMEIVPVGSLREALDYLEALQPKDTRTGGL
jgi:PDZ domain-containing protein